MSSSVGSEASKKDGALICLATDRAGGNAPRDLTPREGDVALLLERNFSNGEIARSYSVPTSSRGERQRIKGSPDCRRGGGRLSPRECEVALLLSRSTLSNNEIALELGISYGTVKLHVHRILVKLGAKNRLELIRLAAPLQYKMTRVGDPMRSERGPSATGEAAT